MKDWAAPLIATALFALLTPGCIFQFPGKHHFMDFVNKKTSLWSIAVHAVLYLLFLILFLRVFNIHFT